MRKKNPRKGKKYRTAPRKQPEPYKLQSPYSEGRYKLLEVQISGGININMLPAKRSYDNFSREEKHGLYKYWSLQGKADKGKLNIQGKCDQKELARRMSSVSTTKRQRNTGALTHAIGRNTLKGVKADLTAYKGK